METVKESVMSRVKSIPENSNVEATVRNNWKQGSFIRMKKQRK
jgi:hypothetical protein